MASNQQGPTLQVRQAENNVQTDIEYKNPSMPHKTLGHFKAPGGNGAAHAHADHSSQRREYRLLSKKQ
eukprot:13419376-Ditylum_brightwellii.AAC.1